ncbi:MAG: hypothetical protein JSR85_03005 [Proteobacteria bacterium]|nr:hypothetical protein [Pseudomonadota bacterium]
MKLKFLSLFIALGLCVLGSSLSADGPKAPAAPAQTSKDVGIGPSDLLGMICTWIQGLSQAPAQCTALCTNIANPNWADLTCCITSAQKYGKLPSAIQTAASGFCSVGCNSLFCGPSATGTFLGNTCGAVCCNTGWGSLSSINSCLGELSPAETCSGNFAIPQGCVLPSKEGDLKQSPWGEKK